MKTLKGYLGIVAMMILLLTGCSSGNETANLRVTLTDSPGDYDQLNIDIKGFQINKNSNDSDTSGWISMNNSNIGIINLLDFTNGQELTLSNSEFPVGKISQFRIVLGSGNSIKVNGNLYPLSTPSAMQSGLKVKVNESLKEGVSYKFMLDFDAAKSIVETGNGSYILKPVLSIITGTETGSVSGLVNPASENVAVYIMTGSDTIGSSFAPAGVANYLVPGVPPGAYKIVFDPGNFSSYNSSTMNNIIVTVGMVNRVDRTDLNLK